MIWPRHVKRSEAKIPLLCWMANIYCDSNLPDIFTFLNCKTSKKATRKKFLQGNSLFSLDCVGVGYGAQVITTAQPLLSCLTFNFPSFYVKCLAVVQLDWSFAFLLFTLYQPCFPKPCCFYVGTKVRRLSYIIFFSCLTFSHTFFPSSHQPGCPPYSLFISSSMPLLPPFFYINFQFVSTSQQGVYYFPLTYVIRQQQQATTKAKEY